jgi:hypothetical protein
MGDVRARRFLLGAANAALADWFVRYAAEIGPRLAGSDHYPAAEVAAVPALSDGAVQISDLYRALAAGIPSRLKAFDIAAELRSAVELCGAQTALALTAHRPLDLAAAGTAYAAGDLAARFTDNYEYLRLHGESNTNVQYGLMQEDLDAGLGVALWADDRVRGYLLAPGHFANAEGRPLVQYEPPTTTYSGAPLDRPVEGPGHILNVPDLRYAPLSTLDKRIADNERFGGWFGGRGTTPLNTAAAQGTDLLGLARTLYSDIQAMFENRK